MIFITGSQCSDHRAPDVWSLPVAELDAIDDLAEEIVSVSRRIEADTQRLLELIAAFDDRRGWEISGHRGCAEWLAASTGIDIGAARERVRTARALVGLPALREAMGRGDLSFSKVRALTRIATPDNEDDLLSVAVESSAADLERMIRRWRHGSDEEEIDREERRHQARAFSMFPDLDGMIQLRGSLTPEVGALVMKAIEWACDVLYRDEHPAGNAASAANARSAGNTRSLVNGARIGPDGIPEIMLSEEERRQRSAQRRADALAFLAERAMEWGGDAGGGDAGGGDAGGGDAGGGEAGGGEAASGSLAERYQVMVHVGVGTLGEGALLVADPAAPTDERDPHRSEVEPGIRVSAETSRRICCDAGVVRVTHASDGSVLDVGRRTRTIPPALRRALEVRDRGCRFPGCHSRFCEAHHIRHWAAGGETSLANTLLLCRYHHRLLHEGRWKLALNPAGQYVFRSPRGETVTDGRAAPVRSGTQRQHMKETECCRSDR